MTLSVQKRWEIVFLSEHRLGPLFGPSAVAKLVGCSENTVRNWLKTYHDTGDVVAGKPPGRNRKTTPKEDQQILKIAQTQEGVGSEEIAEKMKHQQASLAWAHDHTEFDWQKVIFTDETTIVLNQHPTRVWRKRGARKVY
jgi:DNA-binding transcriptional MerR regulator